MREPLDSTKLKDSGKDFDGIYQKHYNSEERAKRLIQKHREDRVQFNKTDVGL